MAGFCEKMSEHFGMIFLNPTCLYKCILMGYHDDREHLGFFSWDVNAPHPMDMSFQEISRVLDPNPQQGRFYLWLQK